MFYYPINYYSEEKCIYFGVINENNEKKINQGMLKWKESFGARFHLHKFYEIDASSPMNLEFDNYKAR